jgi:OOP family OmpA-OmpF porin
MAFLIVCFCASGALAENRAEAINVTPFIGGFNPDPELPFQNGPAFGIGLGYNFSEQLGAEFTFHYVESDYSGDISYPGRGNSFDLGNGDAKIMIYKLDLLYHLTGLLPGDMIVPYLAAGPGMITWDSDRKDVDTNNDFLLNYGGGLKIFLTKDLALRGDMRNVINFHASDDRGSSFLYTAGLTYEIGGKVKEEVKEVVPEPEPVPAPAPVVAPPPPPAPKEQGAIIFRNINFDFNKANIKAESYPILDEVTEYLKANPNVKMEVQGHTDGKGTAAYNLKLSDKRAAAVKDYLVGKGVAAGSLETKGYGLTKPIAPNDTEENRARNRRVEFKPIQ